MIELRWFIPAELKDGMHVPILQFREGQAYFLEYDERRHWHGSEWQDVPTVIELRRPEKERE